MRRKTKRYSKRRGIAAAAGEDSFAGAGPVPNFSSSTWPRGLRNDVSSLAVLKTVEKPAACTAYSFAGLKVSDSPKFCVLVQGIWDARLTPGSHFHRKREAHG